MVNARYVTTQVACQLLLATIIAFPMLPLHCKGHVGAFGGKASTSGHITHHKPAVPFLQAANAIIHKRRRSKLAS
jgi:hypothetical protein